ncbi:glycoside hydrolase family 76 protein [Melanomma pulvis-pyrius CBS 109.77]|uniref:mannan endo-1,6-alpha-mannosidase n=1 Tax=Melanomma pulvis-pyrius CBS 109.77 TaxID=1314802 RepID=A0A6A6XK68_9PLEO|nr:glycoside hydrolase family 76 protein [Melanomma pulvis-pyrius CBS 109.77]
MHKLFATTIAISSVLHSVSAEPAKLDVTNSNSIKTYSKSLAESIVNDYYKTKPSSPSGLFYNLPENQNGTAEIDRSESGAIWDALIAYSHLTGDLQFNDVVAEALYAQMGPKQDFLPGPKSKTPNDEQSQWGLAALSAAEYGFPKPIDGKPTFLKLAQNVFNSQISRWDDKTCKGGLRVFVNDGDKEYFAKNGWSASNFFLLGARLNKLTGNKVYALWAERQFKWAHENGLIGKNFEVYDLMHTHCDVDHDISTNLNLGHWIEGSAVLFSNVKGNYDTKPWKDRVNGLLATTKTNPNLYHMPSKPETAPYDLIKSSDQSISNTVQYARSLSHTTHLAPFTSDTLMPNITNAAKAASGVCGQHTMKTEKKESKIKMACTADWRGEGPKRLHKEDDLTVTSAAAALEVVQGLLWAMPKDKEGGYQGEPKPSQTTKKDEPKETKKPEDPKETKKPEEPKKTDRPDDPKQTAKPENPKQTTKPEDSKQTTKPGPQPTTTNQGETQPSQSTTEGEARPSQTSTDAAAPPLSPTTSASATPSGESGGSETRARQDY